MTNRYGSVIILSLFLFSIISGGLITSLFYKDYRLWLDEILSMILLSDRSLVHMTQAITTGIDASPPLFLYVYSVIGNNVLVLKAVSVLFFAGGVAVLYNYLARLFNRPLLLFVLLLVVVALTGMNYNLSSQIRNYALFLFLSALYFVSLFQFATKNGGSKHLLWMAVSGLFLAFVHNFGLIYIATSAGLCILLAIWAREYRYLMSLIPCLIAGFFWLIVWYPHFVIQADTGKPYGWIPQPTFSSFFIILDSLLPRIPVLSETNLTIIVSKVVLLAMLFLTVLLQSLRMGYRQVISDPARMVFLLSAGIFWGVILISLIASFAYTPIFYGRYFWPSHLLVIVQIAYLCRYVPVVNFPYLKRFVLAGVALACGAYLFRQNKKVVLFPEYVATLTKAVPANSVVFFEIGSDFLTADYYALTNSYFLLNWKASLKNRDTLGFKLIGAIREQYGKREIIPEAGFNKVNFPFFYVVDKSSYYLFEQYFDSGAIRIRKEIKESIEGYRILECEWR